MSNKVIYIGLVASQLFTLAAYVVVTAGAALLQEKANNLKIWSGLSASETAGLTAAYNDVFQSTTYIIPYPQQPQYQFQYQWWIIEFEFFAFCWSLAATAFPSILHRLRPVALTFIASALVLVMDNINALFFLIKNDTAKAVFDEYRINVALAGLILVGAANFMTIIFLGLYDTDSRPEVAYKEKDVQKGAETA
jgi:hypothetical protein